VRDEGVVEHAAVVETVSATVVGEELEAERHDPVEVAIGGPADLHDRQSSGPDDPVSTGFDVRPTGYVRQMPASTRSVPLRLSWAVDGLALSPTDTVLEFGCGPGIAAGLAAAAAPNGSVLAVDRSPTAVTRARDHLAAQIADGRVTVEQTSLDRLRTDRRFDVAFAVNVNLFWTSDALAESQVLSTLLRPAGALHLVYDGPDRRALTSAERAAATLARLGWTCSVLSHPTEPLARVVAAHAPPAPVRLDR
jgi:SAM-dependent methyltransferase